jgi:hypothetical protein
MGKADGACNPHPFQFSLYLLQFLGETRGIAGLRKISMGPAVIADLKTHFVNFRNLLPGHKIFGIVHPALGHKEGSSETEFLEEGPHEGSDAT